MLYNRCGKSGLRLPAVSLGLWHNFGGVDSFESARAMVAKAFELGVTHFDLANNYGPPPGSAEECFGRILKKDFAPAQRDQMLVSTKAGYLMWPGPYGDGGSRKYILASLDQSLLRLGLDYVDIFYHHRPDSETPVEESMSALAQAVRQGKALYAGISNYKPEQAREAIGILRSLGAPCLIHQASYSMFNRWVEGGLLDALDEEGVGCIAFSPLAQGLLSGKYLNGIPAGSRASKPHGFLKPDQITPEKLERAKKLQELAKGRGQTLPQMALSWVLRRKTVASVLVGASSPEQLVDSVACQEKLAFSQPELDLIDSILGN